MYRPLKYQKDDKEFIKRFIQQHPFATFVINGDELLATHIPVLLRDNEESWLLFSHIAKHNAQLKYLKDGVEALVIFHGANAYVSSSWYQEKDISTWDYSAVHVNARIRLQTPEELENSLDELVAKFERPQEKPLYYHDIPRKMIEDHLPLITGFWLEPVKVNGIAKFHQASSEEDIKRTIDKLSKSDNSAHRDVAQAIKEENNIR